MHHRPISWLTAVIRLAFPPMHSMFNAEWTRIAAYSCKSSRGVGENILATRSSFTSGQGGADDSPNKHSGTTRASRERVPGIAAKYGEPQFRQSCER
jgi:hypothetical protein